VYLKFDYPNQRTEEEKFKAWMVAWDSVQSEIPKLRSGLEAEFRKLLGATALPNG
jgi:hypothetical protein